MSNIFTPYDPSRGKQYPPVDPYQIARVEIFPPIGFARVGDSGVLPDGTRDDTDPVEYYYAPEVPGLTEPPFGPLESFRDKHQRIKRQAVRFRVYAYDVNGNPLGEINLSQGYEFVWTVHVANKKAAYYESSGMYRPRKTTLRNPDTDPLDGAQLDGSPFDASLEGRRHLIVDPGARTFGPGSPPMELSGTFDGSDSSRKVRVVLGELRSDLLGRLVFLGGSGRARSVRVEASALQQPAIISELDSIDWIDDICDGWVSVHVMHPARPEMAERVTPHCRATVCTAPPKFAWGMHSPTSLYDILENKYKISMGYQEHSGTDFYKDIWPVLMTTYNLSWVNEKVFQGHGPGAFGDFQPLEPLLSSTGPESQAFREHVFGKLREPDFRNKAMSHAQLMPRLSGDDGNALEPGIVPSLVTAGEPIRRFAALTRLQYDRFEAWKNGVFVRGKPLGTPTVLEDYPPDEQPMVLTRAALEQAIGDPLFPGVEAFWIAKLDETWDTVGIPTGLRPPFRVDHDKVRPGFLTRGLSLPWQSNFDLCNTHWWPSTRPDDVIPRKEAIQALRAAGANSDFVTTLSVLPRMKWSRGLRETPQDTSTVFFPGSTDMVAKWNQLGFVARMRPAPNNAPPVWVEQDRTAAGL
ncbi:LodA-like domain-containing protein [Phanerochaete sordida]|uniref:LodA-like domain-containing protein n=1 Tax=Phanerochaete sordida TaxID=48140 RepID=A0A9P3GQM5_9APHY|nr:LodA-like domain-containing protein [Phanerochaete sordida]